MKWYLKVLRHYADFGGRARRKEYWYFVLFNFIAAIIAMIIDAILEMTINSHTSPLNYGPCYMIYIATAILPALAVAVRRLHDLGKSGWMLFIVFIPFVGGIWLFVLFCTEGDYGENRYGSNPKLENQHFPELRRRKNVATAFIVGATAALIFLIIQNIMNYDLFDNADLLFLVLVSLSSIFMLLFGIFYYPVNDSGRTANRQYIAFVLLAIAAFITSILYIFLFFHSMIGSSNGIDFFQMNRIGKKLALLAFVLLLLFKSEQNNITSSAVLLIVFTVLGVVLGVARDINHGYSIHFPAGEILNVAIILLAAHYLPRKTAKGKPSLIPPETVSVKMTAPNKPAVKPTTVVKPATVAKPIPAEKPTPVEKPIPVEKPAPSKTQFTLANLEKIRINTKASDILAMFGEPHFKMSAEAAFAFMGFVPASEKGKEYWQYNTAFGDFRVAVKDNLYVVATDGLENVIEKMKADISPACDIEDKIEKRSEATPVSPQTQFTPRNPKFACNMPLSDLKRIFLFTDGDGQNALVSRVVAITLQDTAGALIKDIIGKVSGVNAIRHSSVSVQIRQTGKFPDIAWNEMDRIDPENTRKARTGIYKTVVRMCDDSKTGEHNALVLIYQK
jgi:uncharacterized membrane protein YhaH (DUF805 family)